MSEKNFFERNAPYFSMGIEIAVAIALPILLGYWLDIKIATYPWLTLSGCIIGVINVFVLIVKIKNRLNDE